MNMACMLKHYGSDCGVRERLRQRGMEEQAYCLKRLLVKVALRVCGTFAARNRREVQLIMLVTEEDCLLGSEAPQGLERV